MNFVVAVAVGIGFFALILASIALHEVGHLVPAKLFGVKVTRYFVGFGRTLWSVRRGETEYGIKAIPLGGYVQLIGMYPPGRGGRTGRLAELAESAREAERGNYTEADVANDRLFYQKATWQKLIVMFGGPAMNLLLAFAIFAGVNAIHGQFAPTLTVEKVSACVPAPAGSPCVPTPASRVGLRPGDQIVGLNGQQFEAWRELSDAIRANGAGEARLTVLRDGARLDLPATNTLLTQVVDRTDPAKVVTAGFLGVTPALAVVHPGPLETLRTMGDLSRQSVAALGSFPVRIFDIAVGLVTGRERSINDPMSVLGASVAAGEIATNSQLTPGDKWATLFLLLGSVNLFVALLNLVPLLPFDGGHIAGALWEGLRRGAAKLLRRPDPGHVDTARLLPVAYVVGGFLVLAGAILLLADIVSPVKLF